VQCGRVSGLTAGHMPAAGDDYDARGRADFGIIENRLMDEDRSIRRRLSAILAADIAGYSRLMGQDEAATVRDLKGHQAAILPLVERHGGRVIDTAGDGILAEFPSVVGATACAAEIQRVMAARNAEAPEGRRMLFRIGVNLGDVIHDDTRIYGDGINIAARLEGLAEPGGMLVSQAVHEQVRDRLDLAFEDLGERTLKNIARPVRVYRLRERAAPAEPAPAPTGALSLPDKPSIAVLPFSNMSGDADQEFFADGIAEDILTGLARLRWLFVIARKSSFTYKGRHVDVRQVGRELGVRYVLEGSVTTTAARCRQARPARSVCARAATPVTRWATGSALRIPSVTLVDSGSTLRTSLPWTRMATSGTSAVRTT
jgi:adenylate cyclase